jgi:hypothetical protein
MPMLHNSGSTFDTDTASHFYSPGEQQLQSNKMASVGVDPSTNKDYVFYSFDDTASLPAGAEVFNLTNIDGFQLNAGYDYEMIIEGSFFLSQLYNNYDPNQTYDVVFRRGFITSIDTFTNAHEIARFSSNTTGGLLSFRRYVGINMDYQSTRNNFVWSLENVNYDNGNYSVAAVRGTWGAYVIPARREIIGNV